jgi:hypothetical protein
MHWAWSYAFLSKCWTSIEEGEERMQARNRFDKHFALVHSWIPNSCPITLIAVAWQFWTPRRDKIKRRLLMIFKTDWLRSIQMVIDWSSKHWREYRTVHSLSMISFKNKQKWPGECQESNRMLQRIGKRSQFTSWWVLIFDSRYETVHSESVSTLLTHHNSWLRTYNNSCW